LTCKKIVNIVIFTILYFFQRQKNLMNKSISLAEAKATLSECIREVERGYSLLITRHGKPVAALVRSQDVENLERLRKAGPEGGLASLAGGWEGADELVRFLEESSRLGQRGDIELDQ
jgi:prevent-host-death family protein